MHTHEKKWERENERENGLFNIYLLQLQLVNIESEASKQISENKNRRRRRQADIIHILIGRSTEKKFLGWVLKQKKRK